MDTTCDYYPSDRRPSPELKRASHILMMASLAFLAIVFGSVSLIWWTTPRQPMPVSSPSAKAPAANDPWPECVAIRKWLAENTGDPKSVEIVQWIERRNGSHAVIEGRPLVFVKYRLRNIQGGFQVETRIFGFKNGKVEHTTDTNNRLFPGEILK